MLKPWRELVEPHSDVRKGVFQESEFAADISRVHAGDAPEEYQNPALFFQRTYITEGMKLLLHSVLRRLHGMGGDPVIQLQTAFGGGKTHTLLAVYHLAQATCFPSDMPGVSTILDEVGLTELSKAKVAVIDGIKMSANQPAKRGSCMVNTLWGELAWQLGGTDGYALVEASDRAGTSPGKEVLEKLLRQASPCVLLMDELVAYFRQFSEKPLSGGTFSSNLTFIQALTEALKAVPKAVLLASLPESAKEAGDVNGQRALDTLAHTFGRVQALWKPVDAEEAFEIVRRRLFSAVTDRKNADAVCKAFADFYRENAQSFPQETQESHYEARLRSAYPIHPEVFDRLYEDWSSLDNFQRTRGVLKLMAQVIFRLWKDGNNDPLIMPGNLPLYDSNTRNGIIYYLPQGWDPVVDKDIDGENAQPTQLDTENTRFGTVQACRRVARTIFLGSAPSGNLGESNIYRGIDEKHMFLGAALPSASIGVFRDAANRLCDKLYYLNKGNDRFWFNVRPNLRREMEDRKSRFTVEQTFPFMKETLRTVLRGDMFSAVHVFAESCDIPDDDSLRLVVLPPREAYSKTDNKPDMEYAQSILEKKGEQPRLNRNRVIFLASEYNNVSRLVEQVKTMLAWKSIVSDSREDKLILDQLQLRNAQSSAGQAEQVAKQSVLETYKWLLVPQAARDNITEIDWGKTQLAVTAKPMQEIEQQLHNKENVITRWAPIHLRGLLDSWYWKNGVTAKNAMDIWHDLCKYIYMPRLQNKGVFADTVNDGTASRDFFGVAQGSDGKKFLGFTFGRQTLFSFDNAVQLISVQCASDYEASLQTPVQNPPAQPLAAPREISDGLSEPPASPYSHGNSGAPASEKLHQEKVLRRFIGNVNIDTLSCTIKTEQVFNEIIHHLFEYPGSSVKIVLEIEANTDAEQGFDIDIQRTVKENCRSLEFKLSEFE